MPSPIGWIHIHEQGGHICALNWSDRPAPDFGSDVLDDASAQLAAYFDHRLERFDLPMSCPSTPFQHGVFEAMLSIPFGATRSYGEIGAYVDGSPQAVGRACGANPIPILIPCHRVVGATNLGGFSGSGGVETKVWLLRHEGAAGLLL